MNILSKGVLGSVALVLAFLQLQVFHSDNILGWFVAGCCGVSHLGSDMLLREVRSYQVGALTQRLGKAYMGAFGLYKGYTKLTSGKLPT